MASNPNLSNATRPRAAVVTSISDQRNQERARTRAFIIDWVFALMFYDLRHYAQHPIHDGMDSANSGPALIDVVTDPNALSMPSHISADQLKGFGLTMMKLVLSNHIDEVVETAEANIRQM
jgi:hypothetical protein